MQEKIETAIYGGSFRTATGQVLPFVLPGEVVEVEPGEAARVIEPASTRRQPACVHFGTCGGCHYQHAEYFQQLAFKKSILAGLLRQAGLVDLPPITAVEGPEWGYRNRIRLRVEQTAEGLRYGYNLRGTNHFLPVLMCPIAAPVLWRAAEALLHLAAADQACARWLQSASELELFCSGDEQRLQLQLFVRDARSLPTGRLADFCEAVHKAVPELTGAGAMLDPELNRRARRAWAGETWGAAGLLLSVGGHDYWVSRGAFFQVNRFLVERLVELVAEGAAGKLAWDLYAGVGLFSHVLAKRFARVIAVEGGEIAARDLTASARKAGFSPRREPAVDFLRAQEHQRERPDLVVLDPPRAGLGLEGAALLGRSGAARIVYVSCDPETLVRDLAVLVRAGYRIERVTLIDLFPQTFHLESVVWLRNP